MPGRYALFDNTAASFSDVFGVGAAGDQALKDRYNICPTQNVPAVVTGKAGRRLVQMRWGFIPRWYESPNGGPLLINARSETLANKPAFREACRSRRCLVPASGFYEWTKSADGRRLPWFIRPADGGMFAFAGVWQEWVRGDVRHVTCAIVTTSANRPLSEMHHRMAVVIQPGGFALWLGEAGHGAATLMRPAEDDFFTFHRVGTEINSNRAEGPGLIEPYEERQVVGNADAN